MVTEKFTLEHSYDFSTGVDVEAMRIKQWHKDVLDKMENTDSDYASIASGNSIVIANKMKTEEGTKVTVYEIRNGYTKHEYCEKSSLK